MIRAGVSEIFTITATLIDEINSIVCTGNTVLYEIRKQPEDLPLAPPLIGMLIESIVTPGIYNTTISISMVGTYLAYITSTDFVPYSEEIIIAIDSDTPVITSEGFGSMNMIINSDSIRLSTKSLAPIMRASSII